jgi:Arm domain-containing DNA-binding protein
MPKFNEGFAAAINVPSGARDVLVFDTEVRGFGIRKFAGGGAYYFVKYTHEGKQRRQSLGEVTRGNLRAMRLLASEVKSRARAGQDIIAEKQAAEAKTKAERAAIKNRRTIGAVVTDYLTARKRELRHRSVRRRML